MSKDTGAEMYQQFRRVLADSAFFPDNHYIILLLFFLCCKTSRLAYVHLTEHYHSCYWDE